MYLTYKHVCEFSKLKKKKKIKAKYAFNLELFDLWI